MSPTKGLAIEYVLTNKFDELKSLTNEQLTEVDENGRNAMHAASFKGNIKFLNYIIEKLGDNVKEHINNVDNDGRTVAMYCCGVEWN